MAQTTIKIASDSSQFQRDMQKDAEMTKPFTTQLRQAKREALNLTNQFRSLSDELKNSDYGRDLERQMQDAIKKAGELQDTFGDVHDEIKNFASDTQFADGMRLMTSTVGSLSTAMVALTGDSDNMKKVLMDIAKIQATVQAVKQLTDAFQKQNLVLLKNPYVLVSSAIAALGVAIYEYTQQADKSTKSTNDYRISIEKLGDAAEIAKYSISDLTQRAVNNAKIQDAVNEFNRLGTEIAELEKKRSDIGGTYEWYDGQLYYAYDLQQKLTQEIEKQKSSQQFQQNLIKKYLGENKIIEASYEKQEQDTKNISSNLKAAVAEAKRMAEEQKKAEEERQKQLKESLQLEKDIKAETKYDVYDFLGGAAPDFRGQFSTEQMKPTALVEEVDDDKLDFTSVLENDWVAVNTLKEIIKELNEEMGKAKTPEAYNQYAELVEKVNQKLAEQTDNTDESEDSQSKLQNRLKKTAKIANQVGNAFSTLGNAFELPALNIMGVIGQAIANTALAFGDALAKDQTSKTNIFAFIAASVSAVATMATLISQIKSITSGYANGGIIQGASTIGDLNLARVNDGEMILNSRQQKNLWNMMNNGIERQPVTLDTSKVEFRLRGQELIGVISNTNKKMSKI